MKIKATLLSIGFMVCVTASLAQYAYYDALFLKGKLSPQNMTGNIALNNAVKDKLSKYFGPLPNFTTQAQIDAFFITNPFFRNSTDPSISIFSFTAAAGVLNIQTLLSSAGNMDVTNLADGFAKFLVKRTKQELNIAFFEKFKNIIHKPGYEDALVLFPQTVAVLDAIGDEIYNYEAYINALRESFESDLNGLPLNLRDVINSSRYNGAGGYFVTNPELKSTCLSILDITNGLLNKEHPGSILANFDPNDLNGFNTTNINIKASVQTLQIFSESLRSIGTDHYWISSDSLNLLLSDPITLQFYLGLLYQKATPAITFSAGGSNVALQTLLSNLLAAGNNINDISTYTKGLIKQATILTQSINNISGKEKDKINFSDYYNLYSTALDLFEYGSKINKFPGLSSLNTGVNFVNFLNAAKAGGNIALDINRKNYSSAIINTYQLYNFTFNAIGSGNDNFKKFLLKYGSFMASVSQAQNSDDVEKAIESVALPTGSSRIKRETSFNVALNGYAGLFIGHEVIQDIVDKSMFNTYGVAAPIGISISRGHSIFFISTGDKGWKENKYGWSTSLFLSVIDLGAVAAFRFKDDKTAQVPTIQLKNIFSPGAFISLGIPKSPLSLNLGAQVGPNLRKIDNNDATLASKDNDNKTYIRYSFSLLVDIPLLNFASKSR